MTMQHYNIGDILFITLDFYISVRSEYPDSSNAISKIPQTLPR